MPTLRQQKMMTRKFCIYAIQCSKNKKIYVGATHDIDQRLNTHFINLRKNCHTNKPFQDDYNNYGEHSFVVYRIAADIPYETYKQTEQDYIDKYKTREPKYGYNILHSRVRKIIQYQEGEPNTVF